MASARSGESQLLIPFIHSTMMAMEIPSMQVRLTETKVSLLFISNIFKIMEDPDIILVTLSTINQGEVEAQAHKLVSTANKLVTSLVIVQPNLRNLLEEEAKALPHLDEVKEEIMTLKVVGETTKVTGHLLASNPQDRTILLGISLLPLLIKAQCKLILKEDGELLILQATFTELRLGQTRLKMQVRVSLEHGAPLITISGEMQSHTIKMMEETLLRDLSDLMAEAEEVVEEAASEEVEEVRVDLLEIASSASSLDT